MRLISIKHYNEQSMKLAKPVYDAKRRMLLAADHTIHPKILERLIQLGIRVLFVEDAESRGITMEEMMDLPTWIDVVLLVREIYEAVGAKRPFPLKSLLASTGKLIAEVRQRPVLVPVPASALPLELRPYAHAVNVALLSLQVGKQLGYHELMLRDLGVGCLLHDIGKAVTEDERRHPEAGFNLLRSIRELSLLSAHVAFQHHERLDGGGYPRAISGTAFHDYAQICAVSNAYDNLLTIRELLPHDAMEAVMAMSGTVCAASVAEAFVKSVPGYPPGTKVRLAQGEEAIVTKIMTHMQRPVVRTIETGEEFDLSEHPTLMIAGVL